ncbi:MAG TPA: TetR/AcrR family transcriptional regulator [Steroidobacteraceae bacterium]|nr:TetR/AcrR family transcriptional regulator [Steroidobacteraceae bacterium]
MEVNQVDAKELKKAGLRAVKDAHRARRPRRTQEERSAQTRRQLVNAAIRVLQESGYANLTISKVADRAGLTNGAMQHHFSSREDLVIAVLDALYPALEMSFVDVASRKSTVKDRVGAFIDLLWQIYSRPEYLVIWDIAFGTRADAPFSAKLQVYQRDISAHMRKQLAASFADLEVTAEGTEQIFSLVASCLRGFALQTVFGVDRRRFDLDQVKEIACERIAKYSSRKK